MNEERKLINLKVNLPRIDYNFQPSSLLFIIVQALTEKKAQGGLDTKERRCANYRTDTDTDILLYISST